MHQNITSVAALIGDPARTEILMSLADGRALPAGELAKIAGVSPQAASAHLSKLLDGGLVRVEAWSRHRYYRLAGPDVAHVLEVIASIAPPAPARSLRRSQQIEALRHARTCYNHIAGALGVACTRALVDRQCIEEQHEEYVVTAKGENWFRSFGIAGALLANRRTLIPWHNDWTERVHHMAGPVALALTSRMFALGWIDHGRIRRSVVVTDAGRKGLAKEFNLRL